MNRRPSPSVAFQNAYSDFDSFLLNYPALPAWQGTLGILLSAFPKIGVNGRKQGSVVCQNAKKAISASQQNAVSTNGVLVWIYLWDLKLATQSAYEAFALGETSPNAPSGPNTYGVELAASASLALNQLGNWHPELPAAISRAAPGNVPGLLLSLAEGTTVMPESSTQQGSTSAFLVHTLRPGDTLRSLATRYLGDPSLWSEIAQMNHLRYPYISGNLAEQYGPPSAEWILQTVQTGTSADLLWAPPIASQGASQAVLPGPTIYPGEIVVFHQGDSYVEEAATVKSVSGNTVTFTSTLQNAYPAGSRAYLCPPTGNQNYTVLGFGDAIRIPTMNTSATAPSPSAVAAPDLMLGTDLQVDQHGYLTLTGEGDLATTSGLANLQQAIQNRIATTVGALALYPAYGSNFLSLMAEGTLQNVLELDLTATLLQDPRISRILSMNLVRKQSGGASVLEISASLALSGFTSPQIVSVSVPIAA